MTVAELAVNANVAATASDTRVLQNVQANNLQNYK
jgi:hypothetical protein